MWLGIASLSVCFAGSVTVEAPRPDASAAAQGGNPVPSSPWVVNMIPATLGAESSQDSEAFLAIHPTDPAVLVATAFTFSANGWSSAVAPIYVSTDSGTSWFMVDAIPNTPITYDATIAFHPAGIAKDELWASVLRRRSTSDATIALYELRSASALATMSELGTSGKADQPHLSLTRDGQPLVAHNDLDSLPGPAIDRVDGSGVWDTPKLDTGTKAAPAAVRVSVADDGVAYAAFFRRIQVRGRPQAANAAVVVKRDDVVGTAPFFEDLGTAPPHERVISEIDLPIQQELGQQRLESTLSIAVDPTNSSRVWIAWCDRTTAHGVSTLHVWRSADSGETWTDCDHDVGNATNAALAVGTLGVVGLTYQKLVTDASNVARWETHLEQLVGSTWHDTTLATWSATQPGRVYEPYLSDYGCLLFRDGAFHGVFCGSNDCSFGTGVTGGWQRQRHAGTGAMVDTAGNTVPASIDPFYFRVPVVTLQQSVGASG